MDGTTCIAERSGQPSACSRRVDAAIGRTAYRGASVGTERQHKLTNGGSDAVGSSAKTRPAEIGAALVLALLVEATALPAATPYIPRDGLVGEWLFNGNAADTSGQGNNGQVNGAVLATDRFGNPNSAYSFNGSNAYIQLPNSNSLQIGLKDYTIAAWIKTDTHYAGLVGAGLYQLDVTVPNVPSGDAAVVAQIGGVQTQTGVSITIQ